MSTTVDPITLTVIWNTLMSIAEELGVTLRHTAFSEGVREGDGHQGVPDHRERDGINGCAHVPSSAMRITRWPASLTRATSPGSTTVVLSGSSMMAGPITVSPPASAARSRMRVST